MVWNPCSSRSFLLWKSTIGRFSNRKWVLVAHHICCSIKSSLESRVRVYLRSPVSSFGWATKWQQGVQCRRDEVFHTSFHALHISLAQDLKLKRDECWQFLLRLRHTTHAWIVTDQCWRKSPFTHGKMPEHGKSSMGAISQGSNKMWVFVFENINKMWIFDFENINSMWRFYSGNSNKMWRLSIESIHRTFFLLGSKD